MKAERAPCAETSDGPSVVGGEVCLRRIFEDRKPVTGGKALERRDVCQLAVQVHRQHEPGAFVEGGLDRVGREVRVLRTVIGGRTVYQAN